MMSEAGRRSDERARFPERSDGRARSESSDGGSLGRRSVPTSVDPGEDDILDGIKEAVG